MQAVYNVTHDSDEFVKEFMIAHEKVNIQILCPRTLYMYQLHSISSICSHSGIFKLEAAMLSIERCLKFITLLSWTTMESSTAVKHEPWLIGMLS